MWIKYMKGAPFIFKKIKTLIICHVDDLIVFLENVSAIDKMKIIKDRNFGSKISERSWNS